VATVEVHTRLLAPESGTYLLGASGLGHFRLTVDGALAFDATLELQEGADPVEGMMRPPQQSVPVELEAGQEVPLVLSYQPQEGSVRLMSPWSRSSSTSPGR